MKTKGLYVIWLSLISLALSGCAAVAVPNTEVCAVAGRIRIGANCVSTLSDDEREMTYDEFIDFLEPQEDPPRSGALCQSAEDWNKQKTALEEACAILKDQCKFELKRVIKNITRLQEWSDPVIP